MTTRRNRPGRTTPRSTSGHADRAERDGFPLCSRCGADFLEAVDPLLTDGFAVVMNFDGTACNGCR